MGSLLIEDIGVGMLGFRLTILNYVSTYTIIQGIWTKYYESDLSVAPIFMS